MCELDFDDGEPCRVWREQRVGAARKPHRCDCCGRTISAGQTYVRHFSAFGGASSSGFAMDEKICPECVEDREHFALEHGGVLLPPSAVTEYLVNCISEGDEESDRIWAPMLDRINARGDS